MIIVFTTCPTDAEARELAEKLVTENLAACVQVVPGITSFYRWEDKLQRDREFLLLIKTVPEKFAELETFIRANHSYSVPEIVAVESSDVSKSYLKWIVAETAK